LLPRGIRRKIKAYLKDHKKDFNLYLFFIAILSMAIFMLGAIYLPNMHGRSPDFIIDWLAINKHARYVLIGSTFGYLIFVIKFFEFLYRIFLSDES